MDHGEELLPYMEPLPNSKDPGQTELMVSQGYTMGKDPGHMDEPEGWWTDGNLCAPGL